LNLQLIAENGLRPDDSGSILESIIADVRGRLICTLISGACGLFPKDVLDPAASLLYVLLRCTPGDEAGNSVIEALHQDTFKLGDKGRSATVLCLGKCAQGTADLSRLMDLFYDLCEIHQTDDIGSTVEGGDEVAQFATKYGN